MQLYLVTFLEGLISFISPCVLPMIPLYVSYFAGTDSSETVSTKKTLLNATLFVSGFSVVFITLGIAFGGVGSFAARHLPVLTTIAGIIMILFALSYLGLFSLPFFKGLRSVKITKIQSPFGAFLFGMVFSINLSACVGIFLGSALAKAALQGQLWQGGLLLAVYSLGLGVPFILSALAIDQLKNTFDFIKRHYKIINIVSGILLLIVGILILTGHFGRFLLNLST